MRAVGRSVSGSASTGFVVLKVRQHVTVQGATALVILDFGFVPPNGPLQMGFSNERWNLQVFRNWVVGTEPSGGRRALCRLKNGRQRNPGSRAVGRTQTVIHDEMSAVGDVKRQRTRDMGIRQHGIRMIEPQRRNVHARSRQLIGHVFRGGDMSATEECLVEDERHQKTGQ